MFEKINNSPVAECESCGEVMGHPNCHHTDSFRQYFFDLLKRRFEEGGVTLAANLILGKHKEGREYTTEELSRAMIYVRRAVAVDFEISSPF